MNTRVRFVGLLLVAWAGVYWAQCLWMEAEVRSVRRREMRAWEELRKAEYRPVRDSSSDGASGPWV